MANKTKKIKYRTFDEWSQRGYKIIKGSKARKINIKDQYLFGSDQVVKLYREFDSREIDLFFESCMSDWYGGEFYK